METVKFHQNFVCDFWAQTFPISSIYMLPKLQTKIIRNGLDVLNLYITKIKKKKKKKKKKVKLSSNPHFIYCSNYLTEPTCLYLTQLIVFSIG